MSLASAKIAMIEKVSENSNIKGILNRVPFLFAHTDSLPEPAVLSGNSPFMLFLLSLHSVVAVHLE